MNESAAVEQAIERAVELLGMELDREAYEIHVSTVEGDAYVSFTMPIKYVPLDTAAYYGVTVDLTNEFVYYSSLSNPEGYYDGTGKVGFYEPTEEDRKSIDFVAEAISRDSGFDFRLEKPQDEMVIYERDTHFTVTVTSRYQESFYKIEKETGRIYDEGHAHLVPPPEIDFEPEP
jgi:hypothetical protein